MSLRHRVLITDRFAIEALSLLKAQSILQVETSGALVPSAEELADVEALIIRSRTPIDKNLLTKSPRLKVIITATSGFDHIDLAATAARGIRVMFTPEANAQSAAELTWALVLACARKVVASHRTIKGGGWRDDSLTGVELSGKTYGIVGLGRIGLRVARIAQAFGMKVIAFDPFRDEDYFEKAGVGRFSFEEVMKLSDVLSFHVPKTPDTHHMVRSLNLEYIQRGIIVVNTSRGCVIHEADFCEALEQGWIGAAGFDVFEKEPLARTSFLLQYPNVVLTPHVGAATSEAFLKASREAAEKVVAYFTQGAVTDELPPKDLWYSTAWIKSNYPQE